MWPAQIKGIGATFAVSIKTETTSSSPGRTDSAWSSAWRESATHAMKSSASPALCRAQGGEVDVAQVEQKMASDVWRTFMWCSLCCVSFAIFN